LSIKSKELEGFAAFMKGDNRVFGGFTLRSKIYFV
jgi:hypothetical protein